METKEREIVDRRYDCRNRGATAFTPTNLLINSLQVFSRRDIAYYFRVFEVVGPFKIDLDPLVSSLPPQIFSLSSSVEERTREEEEEEDRVFEIVRRANNDLGFERIRGGFSIGPLES